MTKNVYFLPVPSKEILMRRMTETFVGKRDNSDCIISQIGVIYGVSKIKILFCEFQIMLGKLMHLRLQFCVDNAIISSLITLDCTQ